MKKYLLILWFLCLANSLKLFSQSENIYQYGDTLIKATQFSIPNSGAFTLLGVNPEKVTTPGFSRDFKLDYFFNGASVKPDIALQFQPFWLFFYKSQTIESYSTGTFIKPILANTSLSLGTYADSTNTGRIAGSVKLTFSKDPMRDIKYIDGVDSVLESTVSKITESTLKTTAYKFKLQKENRDLNRKLDSLDEIITVKTSSLLVDSVNANKINNELNLLELKRRGFKEKIENNEDSISILNIEIDLRLSGIDSVQLIELKKFVKKYSADSITKFRMDVGFGKIYSYDNASLSEFTPLPNGFGFWLNPSIGVNLSKKNQESKDVLLFSGIFKLIEVDSIQEMYTGINFKYLNNSMDLFLEWIPQIDDGSINEHTFSFGGGYEIDEQKLIQAGFSAVYDDQLNFLTFTPTLILNWELSKNLFK